VRNIVQRSAVKMGSEQGFGVDEKVAHHCGPAGHCRFDISGRPLENLFGGRTHWLAHSRYCVVS